MKISAIDIRKHTFEKIFRGYDPDEVDAFLNSLSQEWERFASENSLLKMQLEYAEKELAKLKDIESTLFRTLKAAEDTSKLIEKEANERAEQRIEESKNTANELVTEAENRTAQVIRETEEKLRRFKEEFVAEVKIQERDFRAIENFRDNLIVQLSSLANNTIDTVERFEKKYDKESVLNRMEEIKLHISEIEIPKKAVYRPETNEEEVPEKIEVVLQDDKPEVVFEVVKPEEDIKEEFVSPEPEKEPEQELTAEVEPETKVEEEVVQVEEPVAEEVWAGAKTEHTQSAADAASEALAEMHKSAEKARDTTPGINRPRQTERENIQPKKTGGGGSFFDQI
jgi:cell division initiation protein